jgi:hypothetical protein
MAVTTYSDNFNRANGVASALNGVWVSNSSYRPEIISNQLYAGVDSIGDPSTSQFVHTYRENGVFQSVEAILVTLGSPTSNKGGVMLGAYDPGVASGQTASFTNAAAYWYVLRAKSSYYRIEKLIEGEGLSTGIVILDNNSWNTAPVNGARLKLTYDPNTGELNAYINQNGAAFTGAESPVITVTDPSPLNGSGMGLYLDTNSVMDTWSGSWGVAAATTTKLSSDSTLVSSSDSGSQSVVATNDIVVTDNFNTPGYIGGAGSNWVPQSTTNPQALQNGNVGVTSGGTNAIMRENYSGQQKVSAVLKANNSTLSARAGVIAGSEPPLAGELTHVWTTAGAWYRLNVRGADYALLEKPDGAYSHSTLHVIPITPTLGDVMEIRYDPATGVVECYINGNLEHTHNGVSRPTHTGVGIHIESGNELDNFSATWSTTDTTPPQTGKGFYEVVDPDLNPLFPYIYTNSVLSPVANDKIIEYGNEEPPPPVGDVVYPIHSDLILDKFGVNTGWNRDNTFNNYKTEIYGHLRQLGVRHIRNRIFEVDANSNSRMAFAFDVADMGIQITANMGQTSSVMTSVANTDVSAALQWAKSNPGIVKSFTGLNEPNKASDATSNWPTVTKNWQQKIWNNFNNVGGTDLHDLGMHVSGPALMDQGSGTTQYNGDPYPLATGAYYYLKQTGIANFMDHAQMHRYTNQNQLPADGGASTYPEYVDEQLRASQLGDSSMPIDYTEHGFHHRETDTPTAIWGGLYDPEPAAVYIVRHLLDNSLRSFGMPGSTAQPIPVHIGFLYNLADGGPPTDPNTYFKTTHYPPWGLVNSDNEQKTSFLWVKTTLALFKDPTTTPYTPPPLTLKIEYNELSSYGTSGTAADGGLQRYVVAKTNGTKYVIMWRKIRTWNNGNPINNTSKIGVKLTTAGTPNGLTFQVGGFPIAVSINSSNVINPTPIPLTPQY